MDHLTIEPPRGGFNDFIAALLEKLSNMKTTKLVPTAPGLVEVDGQLFVLANETVTIEYGEFHSVKTGVAVQIPEGSVGLLAETQPMGQRGVTVSGSYVTSLDLSELRVGILNNSRNAFTVMAGTPVARLVVLEASGETLEDTSADDWSKLVEEAKDKRNQEAATLHENAVTNSPATAGNLNKPTGKPDKPAVDANNKPTATGVNADAKARVTNPSGPVPTEVEKAAKEKAEAEKKAKEQKDLEDKAAADKAAADKPKTITGDITTK